MEIQKTDGLISAFFTPLHADGSINEILIAELVDRMVVDGLTGVFVGGTNGEGPSLTLEERMLLTETVVKASGGRLRVIVHVGHASIAEAKKLAKHAGESGADAISAVASFYFKPSSVENLVACMAEIASAAPELPFYYYHIPAVTGVKVDPLVFMQLAELQISNFTGIKFSDPELWVYEGCLNYKNGKFDVLYGVDENLLSALAIGCRGAIGSTYNFAGPLYLKVRSHFDNGRIQEAREIMSWLIKVVSIMAQFSAVPSQKAIMKLLGFEMGPSRLPLTRLTDEQTDRLYSELQHIGFQDYVNGTKLFF
jgi:N-acetylneuraminate lyase